MNEYSLFQENMTQFRVEMRAAFTTLGRNIHAAIMPIHELGRLLPPPPGFSAYTVGNRELQRDRRKYDRR